MVVAAFTLLELSIVLVIIGLIAGGVTVGAEMIHSAELRNVITDVQRYKTATYTFRDKYFAWPGDMTNAYSFWKTKCGSTANDCNGDGNNLIESYETNRTWVHLSLSGLIEGGYTGTLTTPVIIGTNIPSTGINGGGFSYNTSVSGWHGFTRNKLVLGAADYAANYARGNLLSGEDAWSLDKKIDDGIPNKGKVTTYGGDGNWSNTSCTISTYSEYTVNNQTAACIMGFPLE